MLFRAHFYCLTIFLIYVIQIFVKCLDLIYVLQILFVSLHQNKEMTI